MADSPYNTDSENDYYISLNSHAKIGIFNPYRLGKWSSFVYNFETNKHYKLEDGKTLNILDTSLDGKYVAYNILPSNGQKAVFKIIDIEYKELLFTTDDMEILEAYFTPNIRYVFMRAKVHNSISVFIYDIISDSIVYNLPFKTFILDGSLKNDRSEYLYFTNDKNVVVNTLDLNSFIVTQTIIEHIDSVIKRIYCHSNSILLLIDGYNKIFRYEKNNRLKYCIETQNVMPKYQGYLTSMPGDEKFVYFDTPTFYYNERISNMESILYYFNVNDGQMKSRVMGIKGGVYKKVTPISEKVFIDCSGKLYDIKTNEETDFMLKKYL